MPRQVDVKDWWITAVDIMARSGCSLVMAATELGEKVTSEEANKVLRKKAFQDLLWEAKHRHFNQLGSNPNFKKDTAIGKLLDLSRKLEEEGNFDRSAEVLFKIAKLNNWVGPESTVNVFGDLNERDLQAIREKIEKQRMKVN